MDHVFSYCGYQWHSLEAACRALGLPCEHVKAWCASHGIAYGSPEMLSQYIRHHRFIINGIIFQSLAGVANQHAIDERRLKLYLASGFGLPLAVYMITRGYGLDFFKLTKEDLSHKMPQSRRRCGEGSATKSKKNT